MEELYLVSYDFGHPVKMVCKDGKFVRDVGVVLDSGGLLCPKCKRKPTRDGHDPCIANLPGVAFACCGHGVESHNVKLPYIKYNNGKVVRFDTTDELLRFVKSEEFIVY
jgi:hypothetical protein